MKAIFRFDIIIFIAALALAIIGILFIYSSAISSDGVRQNIEFIKQIIWLFLGVAVLFFISFWDYERLRSISLYFYIIICVLLVIVLFFGNVVNGAKSWIGILGIGFQPSEFAKLALILRLAHYFENSKGKHSDFARFFLSLLQMAIPMMLVMVQPDMGTAMVFVPIYLVMAFFAEVKKRYLFFLLATGIIIISAVMIPAWDNFIIIDQTVQLAKVLTNRNILLIIIGSSFFVMSISFIGYFFYKKKYYYWLGYAFLIIVIAFSLAFGANNFIKDYQLKRLIIFLDPQIDPRGAGWNVIQSITAVGSGGTFGKGFLEGTQSHYRYLPQQSTDFIFSIIAEEWGFFGCFIVFILFLIIMIRSLQILLSAKNPFALYIGTGVVSMIFFHFIVNIGMAMGIMPITGIPLLLVSYGGTSILNTMASLGIISSIYLHKYS